GREGDGGKEGGALEAAHRIGQVGQHRGHGFLAGILPGKVCSQAPMSVHTAGPSPWSRPSYVRHVNGRPAAASASRLSSVTCTGMLWSSRPSSHSAGVFTACSTGKGSKPGSPRKDGIAAFPSATGRPVFSTMSL